MVRMFLFLSFLFSCASSDIKSQLQKNYQDSAAQNSDQLDSLIGIQYDEVEQKVEEKYEHFVAKGMDKKITQTDYDIIRFILQEFPPSSTDVVYDIGSGHGRFIFYGAASFPQTQFVGIELAQARVEASRQLSQKGGFKNVSFRCENALSADISDGTYFYLFNPFPEVTGVFLKKLEEIARQRSIRIAAYGFTTHQLRKVPWLTQVGQEKIKNVSFWKSR